MRQRPQSAAIACLILSGLLILTACANSASSLPPPGTLVVQISDHREAIGDFERLEIAIKSVGLHPASAPRTEGWLDFEPDTPQVDLTQVVDEPAATILQTTVPPNIYDAARLVVTGGEGILKEGNPAITPGFEEAARTVLTLQGGDTLTLVMDVTVETRDDHPGGGYEIHLRSVTIK